MTIPKLKRIKVSSQGQLQTWLAKNADCPGEVMIVTCDKTSRDKYLSTAQVEKALRDHGWSAGPRYTLIGNLIGHVVRPG